MASSPFYGDRPPVQGFRRSFTAPHRQLSIHERAGLDKSDADADVLYRHPSVRIISFAPPNESIVSKSNERHADADYPIDTIETLPWRSRTETLLATGEMVIEKVRGSVNFLKCSPVVHSILRNSQCWCVDGESKFVLRKGKLQYYRIELPTTTEEEKAKVEQLKQVLGKVLKFEKTPCPFKRAFQVDLPDDVITPRRKGKWKQREGSLPTSPDSNTPSLRRTKNFRSWSVQGGSDGMVFPESPLRRESDYGVRRGFVSSPLAVPRARNLRPDTPSSLDSSEDASNRAHEEEEIDTESSTSEADHTSPEKLDQIEEVSSPEKVVGQAGDNAQTQPESSGDKPETEESRMYPENDLAAHLIPNNAERGNISTNRTLEDRHQENDSMMPEPLDEHSFDMNGIAISHDQIEMDMSRDQQKETSLFSFLLADVQDPQSPPMEPTTPLDETYVDELGRRIEANEAVLSLDQAVMVGQEKQIETAQIVPLDNQAKADESKETEDLEDHSRSDSMLHSSISGEANEVQPIDIQPNETSSIPELVIEPAEDVEDDKESIASTTESFHTVDSLEQNPGLGEHVAQDLDPTPSAELHDPLGAKRHGHRRDVSEVTVTAASFEGTDEQDQLERFTSADDVADRPTTPRLIQSSASDDSWPDVQTPSAQIQDGLRKRLKSHRSLSPLPPSSTVFAPSRQNYGNHIPTDLLQKAARIAIVKPIEVVVLFVQIVARIAGGATMNDLLSGNLFKQPEQRRRTSSFPDRLGSHHDDEEDDFGVPIRGRTHSSATGPSRTTDAEHDTDTDSLFDLD